MELNRETSALRMGVGGVFYHGSRKYFPNGFILLPQAEGYVHMPETQSLEQLIERYRPPNKLSRANSVFMVRSAAEIEYAGGYEDYIYIVEPMGVVEASDLSWYSDMDFEIDDDATPEQRQALLEEQKTCALNYWNGVPYKDKKHSLWEYRTPKAKIIQLLGDNT